MVQKQMFEHNKMIKDYSEFFLMEEKYGQESPWKTFEGIELPSAPINFGLQRLLFIFVVTTLSLM